MSKLYHNDQQPLLFPPFDHLSPDCTCDGKTCTSCFQVKCFLNFNRQKACKDGRRPQCRDCTRKVHRQYNSSNKEAIAVERKQWRRAHPRYYKAFNHQYNLKLSLQKFELTSEELDAKTKSQNGVCAICGNPNNGRLCIDHDHATGKVRGLLCSKCNLGLGYFRDNPDYLDAAIDYLGLYRAEREEDTN